MSSQRTTSARPAAVGEEHGVVGAGIGNTVGLVPSTIVEQVVVRLAVEDRHPVSQRPQTPDVRLRAVAESNPAGRTVEPGRRQLNRRCRSLCTDLPVRRREKDAAAAHLSDLTGCEEYQRASAVMLRNSEWKLILSIPGPLGAVGGCTERFQGELYHLIDDPLELHNWYNDPACAEIRGRMTTQLLMHVMCSAGRFPAGPARARVKVTGLETKPDNSVWKWETEI
jgi:hypothetical protein